MPIICACITVPGQQQRLYYVDPNDNKLKELKRDSANLPPKGNYSPGNQSVSAAGDTVKSGSIISAVSSHPSGANPQIKVYYYNNTVSALMVAICQDATAAAPTWSTKKVLG